MPIKETIGVRHGIFMWIDDSHVKTVGSQIEFDWFEIGLVIVSSWFRINISSLVLFDSRSGRFTCGTSSICQFVPSFILVFINGKLCSSIY